MEQEILDGKQISEWITQDEKQVSLDTNRIKEYIKQISKKYNTYGRDREFVTTSGNMLELPSGGYGWLINQEEEFIQLMQEINNGSVVKREPVYSVRAFTRGKNDIGTTYVEIDLGKQHLYFYQEEKLVLEADFVSGNMVKGFATPPGVFGITYKARNATLRGEDYATPVSYWMPFNGNVGMHDATWRSMFGGDIYLTNGSHGCINLPYKKANEIFDNIEQPHLVEHSFNEGVELGELRILIAAVLRFPLHKAVFAGSDRSRFGCKLIAHNADSVINEH